MNLYTSVFILLFDIYICEAGYGAIPPEHAQSDVQAPEYVPAYLKNQRFTKTNYPRKTYSGRKTMYSGTKTGYGGTKTGFAERRTWHSSGTGPTYKDFSNTANQAYTGLCDIECKNNGICVDKNECACPPNFHGKYCEFEKKPCLVYPPLPMNSQRKCSSEHCTITCVEGHKFIDGSTIANMRCVEGQWRPTRADLTSIPDCQPECDPPCLNGGVCLSVNTCQCPADYRGPQCQYSASVCDVRKLAFNGGYNCFGDSEKFSCKLNCPSGASFSTPAVELYTCLYSTGVFEPQPIPHCEFNEVIVITPSNHRKIPTLSQVHSQNSTDTTPYEITTQSAGKYGGYNKPVTIVVQDFTPKGGSCLTWAGVHYKTFDGKIYSFQSPCKHILVRDSTEHKYTIAIRHPECERQGYCPAEIIIYLEEKMYSLSIAEDGSVIFRNSKRMIPMPAFLPGIRVSMPSDQVLVNLDVGVTLKWDTNDLVIVEGSVLLWNKTEGLCGTLDGNPENDMTTKEGNIAQTKSVMIASWELNKIGDICDSSPTDVSACHSKSNEDMKNALKFCSKVFSKDKFRKCSKAMDVSQLLEVCQWDYCACTTSLSPEECACRTVSVYAKECLRHGVQEMRAWRDSETCPMKCPEGKIYKSCGSDTQPSCTLPEVTPKDNATCVEGCFCPEGLLLESGRCVPKSDCPCRVRNQAFPPGTVIPKGCNTCKCEAGEWTCTQVPCGARCGAVGDPHYTTFDGLRYNFMGHCTYTLMKSANITIDVENVACSGAITEAMNLAPYKGEGKPSCTKAVNLEYNGANIHLKQGGFILVNGKEVNSLPVNVGDIRIRAASSLFIIIQLPIKVDLWWDGNTRVFVDVPPSFHEQTKGLCGTFNLNQKDDFLTPEGDVEQSALAFANKWKTREFCDDVITKEPEHPCKANIENKESAEKYCSKLKSKLFESCHWFVDVQPYYEDCLYDMCACAGDVSRCLCPVLGDYGAACARSGALVHWRYSVAECELQCSGGQEYTVCADSCLRTCADVALSAAGACRPACVEGCACPAGQVLDNNNVCVPVALCPCYHKGMEFKPGYKEVRAGKRERDLCTCVGARWACSPASAEQVLSYPPAEDLRSACSAADHKEFTTCETKEPLTCKNMHLPQTVTSQECRPGCQCKKGYVLEATTKKCVVPTDCPCHHGGQSYPDGHTMQEECNTCECKSGKWSCTDRKCAGVCGAWGDSHVTTFDGQSYDFEGVCTYLLAKGTADGKDGFSVEMQNEPCGTTGATCSKSVTLRVGRGGGDEEIVSLTKSAPLPDTSNLKRIKLREAGAYVFLDVPSLAISLQWDRGLRVYVKVDSMWQNRVKGLCGNYNSDMRDDFQTPSGGGFAETSPLIFADSWKLKTTCPKPLEVTDHCKERPQRKEWASSVCGAMKRHPFSLCHAEVPAGAFVRRCEADACACDAGADCACACAALAAYAHACAARGVAFKWRTQDLCPMQCDGECTNYHECMSPCPPETCDNTLDYPQIKTVCEKDTCVEGCKPNKTCTEGMIYSNSSLQECIPRAKCKPACMTLEDGREVLEGEIIEEDACHTCRCSRKERICTGQPCATDAVTEGSTGPPETTPHDQPLQCKTGWTDWINRGPPEIGSGGESVDNEPLPKSNELTIGSPMCKPDMMTEIECRTVGDHKTPKETGLNVECSLEKGLVCLEAEKTCPDFEIRVYCKCEEEPFQCLNSSHPNHPHPTDCSKFYECTPDMTNPSKLHSVLKSCGEGLLYNPQVMVCDWPASVIAVRPECGNLTTTTTMITTTSGIIETEGTPPPTTSSSTTTESTTRPCPPGQVFKDCAFPCDKLCDHFKIDLQSQDKCLIGDKCVSSCVDEAVANIKCDFGSMWRDRKTCVPLKDCTCDYNGQIIKPGGVVNDGCQKCQCLDNAMHCDSTECVSIETPIKGSTHSPIMLPEPLRTHPPTSTTTTTPTTTTSTTTTTTTTPIPTTITTIRTTNATTTSVPTTVPIVETTILVKNTETPPPECNPDNYKNLLWEGDPLPKIAFTSSSYASPMFEPQYAVFNGHPTTSSAGSWNPDQSDSNPYIQVELPQREPIYGVMMQGSPLFNQYVTSYDMMYGDDGSVFSTVDGPDGKPKIFRGPVDNKTPMKQMIEPPIEAKFVRIRPITWHEEVAVRFELIGCQEFTTTPAEPTNSEITDAPSTSTTSTTPVPTTPTTVTTPNTPASTPGAVITTVTTPVITIPTTPEPFLNCTEPLGFGAELPIDMVEVSSNYDAVPKLKLDSEGGWKPLYSTPGEWIMFNFTSPRNLTGIKTKGGPSGWVTAYNVMYTSNLSTFNPLLNEKGENKLVIANFDSDSVVLNEFRPPIRAQYLKVLPVKWQNNIEIKVEPIGCFEPYPPPAEVREQRVPAPCARCPGAPGAACSCAAPLHFDGENCVPRDQCPCFVGYIPYPVGSSYRGDDCDECVCKLGGIADCKPAKQCVCEPDLVPTLTPSCECLCEPCTNGTKICPTSKLCLPLDKWCDGLQDCPDDELACTTLAPITETVVTTVVPTVAATIPVTTTVAPTTTTEKPIECPKVECPPGYIVRQTSASHSSYKSALDLPPPRPRYSYQRFYKGAKGGRGSAKGGFSKTSFSKGGYYSPPSRPQRNQAFTLDKPALTNTPIEKKECVQFKCIPHLPPIPPKGSTPAPLVCSTPACPPTYSLRLESVPDGANKCPQYICVPPPERPVFCNVTGRTFSTFDGSEYKYDICNHILARENRIGEWTILLRKKCDSTNCQNQLLILQDMELILVKPNMMIEYNDYEYTVEQTNKICFQKNSFDVNRLGDGIAIKSRKYNFTVLYSQDGDVKIGVSKKYMGRVDGMCGLFNGDARDDRATPGGRAAASLEHFGRAWGRPGAAPRDCRAAAVPARTQRRVWDLCRVLTEEPLSRCAKVLNLDKWRSICLEKICKCADLVIDGTKKTEEECRCLLVEKLVAECMAADKNIDVSSWRMQMDCPAECPPPLVHYDCYRRRCEPACGSGSSCPVEEGQCFPGCYCPEGKLRKADQCVTPSECLDCTCTGVGSPAKYVTFEGDDLPFLGNCTYLASRDTNETEYHKYQVYASNGPCEDNSAAVCTKSVHLIHEKNVIHVNKDLETGKLITTVNGKPLFKYPLTNDWVTISQLNGQDVSVLLPDQHVELTVIQSKMEFTVRVPSFLYSNRTQGLCGVCAGYLDHLTTSNGTITDDFNLYGKSWQASPEALTTLEIPPQEQCDEPPPPEECPPIPPETNPCYNINDVDKFGACHALVEPAPFVAQCEAERCERAGAACAALQRYAALCRRQGVCVDWRRDLCPYPCEAPLVYRPCVDCERTCDNHDELRDNPKKCDKEPIEGCFCPEGKVRVNNTCIEPTKCFPCDANKEHYAGDEWQEDACTKCTCSKLSAESRAHVACTTQACAAPVCAERGELRAQPARPGACCRQYLCVEKPPDERCEEPKRMECGFGQVLKQKTKPDGCKEFACECKPESECEKLPDESEVEMLEPGIERVVDTTGCCPRAELVCVPQNCPRPPTCQKYHTLETTNVTGQCCPEYKCELPKDKCVVTLEWEAAAKGGEKQRAIPQVMLKDMDSAWLDGPCRSCRCESSPLGAVAQCSVTECPAVVSTEQFVLEPRPVPFACCPAAVHVACRDGDNIYKVGENWTSPYDPCESYKCSEVEEGKLEKITTVQNCHTDCQPGWEYSPAPADSKQCCGQCQPVACVVDGVKRDIGTSWTSPDFCTNYTCANLNGTLQVQSKNESCPEIPDAVKKQFVLSEEKIPGECCLKQEPIACRVGNKIYQEGQTWPSSDPCKNYTCARDVRGLSLAARVEACAPACPRGWRYVGPAARACCGRCVPDKCVVGDELKEPGTTWQSADNCTTFTCEGAEGEVYTTSALHPCPDVSACAPEDLVNETCCQVCKEKPSSLSTCVPKPMPKSETVGLIRVHMGVHGLCVNNEPLDGFQECRGSCDSGTLYNNQTGIHDSSCECCQATRYAPLLVSLRCADGSRQAHRVASTAACACARCGQPAARWYPSKTGYSQATNQPTPHYGSQESKEPDEYTVPDMFFRYGTAAPRRQF
ncbi:hemocytin [Nymphalis io]|uniref:hemocytin n=1 Tax=Inachis io TaxID=171585 RepID=UPI0021680177|nr:hemocytin [Nymphalis io]